MDILIYIMGIVATIVVGALMIAVASLLVVWLIIKLFNSKEDKHV